MQDWRAGKAWITPGLLIARGNVAREELRDDVLGQRLRDGYDIGAATAVNDPANMSAFDRAASSATRSRVARVTWKMRCA